MSEVNQNQQWNNQPQTNQQYGNNQQNQFNQKQMNWNNPTPQMASMPQPGSVPWWQMMFNPSMMNWMNNMNGMGQQTNQSQALTNSTVSNPSPVSNTVNQISSARVISSLEDIKPSEIPVDDTTRLFMTDDMQTIYAKKWDNTGELQNMVFQRVPEEKRSNNSTDLIISEKVENQDDRISSLENQIEALLNATTELSNKITKMEVNNSKSTQKKGGTVNE